LTTVYRADLHLDILTEDGVALNFLRL
jgi:hypothetical protein